MLTRKSMQKRKELAGSEREVVSNPSGLEVVALPRPIGLMGPMELMEPSPVRLASSSRLTFLFKLSD